MRNVTLIPENELQRVFTWPKLYGDLCLSTAEVPVIGIGG